MSVADINDQTGWPALNAELARLRTQAPMVELDGVNWCTTHSSVRDPIFGFCRMSWLLRDAGDCVLVPLYIRATP